MSTATTPKPAAETHDYIGKWDTWYLDYDSYLHVHDFLNRYGRFALIWWVWLATVALVPTALLALANNLSLNPFLPSKDLWLVGLFYALSFLVIGLIARYAALPTSCLRFDGLTWAQSQATAKELRQTLKKAKQHAQDRRKATDVNNEILQQEAETNFYLCRELANKLAEQIVLAYEEKEQQSLKNKIQNAASNDRNL